MTSPELDTVHRVYRKEWIIVVSLRQGDFPGLDSTIMVNLVQDFADVTYRSHLGADNYGVDVVGEEGRRLVHLQVRVPVVRAEWRDEQLAAQYVQKQGWAGDPDVWIVARNSRAEYDLTATATALLSPQKLLTYLDRRANAHPDPEQRSR